MARRSKTPAKTPVKTLAKTVAKTPQAKATKAKRTPVKSQKTVARKTTVKETTVAKKPIAKKTAVTKVAAKKPIKTASKTADRDTLAKLRAYVDDIEKRLKHANALTRTSVRALESSYKTLDGDNQTSALTGHIEELSDRLTGMITQTRQDVAHDLKVVLEDPRLETLSGALTKANQRLTAAEQHQAEAINAINVHIARLATAVDERMQREESQREKGDALLSERMDVQSERMDVIEQDSADALKLIGDKVVTISEDLDEKTQSLVGEIRGELAEQAVARQRDYEEHKHDMARRIEAIEDEQRSQLPAFERGIASLALRLETIESMSENTGAEACVAPVAPAYETAPQIAQEDQAALYADTQPDDAFAALETVDIQEVGEPTPMTASPYGHEVYQQEQQVLPEMTPEVLPEQAASAQEYASEYGQEDLQSGMQANVQAGQVQAGQVQAGQVYAPVEYTANVAGMNGQNPEVFSPRAYMAGGEVPIQAEMPPPVLVADNGLDVYNPAMPQVPPMPAPISDLPPMPQDNTANDLQAPEQTMENARPGAEPMAKSAKGKKRKQKKVRKQKNTQKNTSGSGSAGHGMIRKVALFGGVAVVALLGYKTISPKIFGSDSSVQQSAQSVQIQDLNGTQIGGMQVDRGPDGLINEYQTTDGQTAGGQKFESVVPVGDYSKSMAAPNLGGGEGGQDSPQKRTLEAAASDGNPIAQFQLGLSHLEAGRDADAVRLIRLSANQGQPAAQYRLAKLYEAGIGVKVNGKTAKDLLSRSAEAGNRIAMHDLGHYFATGADGSAPDLGQAVKWFSMAADRGVLDSQFNLAVLYQNGNGVPRSLEDAYVWYAIAGAQGDKIAMQRSKAVARELKPEGLKSAKARVKAYAPKPVDNAANGVFNNLPWISAKQAKAGSNAGKAPATSVKSAQKMLSSLGYNVGKPDGAMGPNTRNAIISFERANGLPQTGRVNAALIERLQLAVGA